ncbi:MAG: hypothetical protein AAB590_00565 [Patescibacteria group bacterium]
MTCEQFKAWLDLTTDPDPEVLPPRLLEEALEHMEQCTECALAFEQLGRQLGARSKPEERDGA